MIGFPTITNTDNNNAVLIIFQESAVANWLPKNTKNNTTKKSLSGFIRPPNSKVYLLEARDIPAINAPISIENPAKSNTVARINAQAIPNRNNASWFLAR